MYERRDKMKYIYYVYMYLHPEYGHLYCGRCDNLDKRIYEHNNSEKDNIPRKYESLLKESIVMYVELQTVAQGVSLEAYCIDKFKPFLNIALKYKVDGKSPLNMDYPKWKIYRGNDSKYQECLYNVKRENEQLKSDNNLLIKNIKQLKYELKEVNNQLNYIKAHPIKNIPDEEINKICDELDEEENNKIINRTGRPQEISLDDIELIYRLRERGKSIREIARVLNRSIGSIHRYLNQEAS